MTTATIANIIVKDEKKRRSIFANIKSADPKARFRAVGECNICGVYFGKVWLIKTSIPVSNLDEYLYWKRFYEDICDYKICE